MSLDRSLITFAGDEMRVRFERFDDPSAYAVFLAVKRLPEYRIEVFDPDALTYEISAPARFAGMLGVEQPARPAASLPLSPFLFDDQREIVRMALDAKRFACWSDCGLGKTVIGAEFARHVVHATGGRVLIVTLNEVVDQWGEEIRKFYGDEMPVIRLESREQMRRWCQTGLTLPPDVAAERAAHATGAQIGIVNYEKFNHRDESDQVVHELRHLAGIILDESSRLKTGGGKQKWALIKSSKGIEYKLSLTATPAPNEYMEFASQASWLEKLRDENEIIWTFFQRNEKTHRWSIRKHARKAFFEFMAGWSIYVRDPRKYGWRLDVPQPPPPERFVHTLPCSDEQRDIVRAVGTDESGTGSLFADRELNAIQTNKLSQAAKGFLYEKGRGEEVGVRKVRRVASAKPQFVADLIRQEAAAGLQVLVWTVYDAETEILAELLDTLGGLAVLTGSTPEAERPAILNAFRRGESRVLISRASMLGYGMNFQCCGSMVFSGWSFSYEQYYQAVRRAYRHGQTKRLRVHIPVIPELEGQMLAAICHKEAQHEAAIEEMERNYIAARAAVTGKGRAV